MTVKARVVSIRVDDELGARLDAAAALRGWDVSMFVRDLAVRATADVGGTVTHSAPLNALTMPVMLDLGAAVATGGAAESAQDCMPTPDPAPTPDHGPASATAGGVTVPVEAVEALVRHLSEATLPAAWRTDDRWERCRAGAIEAWGPKARAYLAAAAPLIAAQAIAETQEVAAELATEREWVQRAVAVLRYVSAGRRFVDVEPYPEATARALLGELERGGDRG